MYLERDIILKILIEQFLKTKAREIRFKNIEKQIDNFSLKMSSII
uniref:Uncharacterized protein n=1 Tax=Rhizophora mucronata TaxID=61149 RepID=A0A2P2PBH7_RHIMU